MSKIALQRKGTRGSIQKGSVVRRIVIHYSVISGAKVQTNSFVMHMYINALVDHLRVGQDTG